MANLFDIPPIPQEQIQEPFLGLSRSILDDAEERAKKAQALREQEAAQQTAAANKYDTFLAMAEKAPQNEGEGFEDWLTTFVRGRLAGTPIDEQEDYNEFLDKNEPAYSFLNNGFRAVLAERTGQKFVSVRQEMRAQFEADRKARIDRERIGAQAAAQVTSMLKAQQSIQSREKIAGDKLTFAEKKEANLMEHRGVLSDQQALRLDLIENESERRAAENPLMRRLSGTAAIALAKTGFLPENASDEERAEWQKNYDKNLQETERVAAYGHEAGLVAANPKRAQHAPKTPAARKPFAIKENSWGERIQAEWDSEKNVWFNAIDGRTLNPRFDFNEYGQARKDKVAGVQNAVQSMRRLASIAENDPKLFNGQLAVTDAVMNPALAQYFGFIDAQEFDLISALKVLTQEITVGMFGARASNAERIVVQETLPPLTNPETFSQVLRTRASWMEALQLKEHLGIGANELDLADRFSEMAKTGEVLTGGQILFEEALVQGDKEVAYELVRRGHVPPEYVEIMRAEGLL